MAGARGAAENTFCTEGRIGADVAETAGQSWPDGAASEWTDARACPCSTLTLVAAHDACAQAYMGAAVVIARGPC